MSIQTAQKNLFSVEPPRSLLLSQLWTLQTDERHISKSSIEKLAQQHQLSEIEIEGVQMFSEKELSTFLEKADLVAIITNHDKFDYKLILEKSQLIFDARNAMKEIGKNDMKVIKL